MNSKFRFIACAAALPVMLLAACSSKPEQADIERALKATYDCPKLEIRDVKKLNGAPGPNGFYDVAFSYVAAVKGNEATAVKTLVDGLFLDQEVDEIEKVVLPLNVRARLGQGDGPSQALLEYEKAIRARRAENNPCVDVEGGSIFVPLNLFAKNVLDTGRDRGEFQIGLKIARTGRMTHTENGWTFSQITPTYDDAEALVSQEVPFGRPVSKLRSILTGDSAAAGSDQTLKGVIRKGQTDSCVAVTQAGIERCYGLPADAARIFSVCADGDSCAITGQWDEKTESLNTFSRVEKVVP